MQSKKEPRPGGRGQVDGQGKVPRPSSRQLVEEWKLVPVEIFRIATRSFCCLSGVVVSGRLFFVEGIYPIPSQSRRIFSLNGAAGSTREGELSCDQEDQQ